MLKRTLVFFTIAALLNVLVGCTHTVNVQPEEMTKSTGRISKIALLDGQVVTFAPPGGSFEPTTGLITGPQTVYPDSLTTGEAHGPETRAYSVPVDSVMTLWVQRTNTAGTVILVALAVAAFVGMMVALTADDEPEPAQTESCPFVYSFDGSQYVFDAEPLGGAICPALQRSEYSELEHVAAVDGRYRIKFLNETPETQHLDQVRLAVVDHEPGRQIVPDESGVLHLVRHAVPPSRAVDETGASILPFVVKADGMPWQTIMTETGLSKTPGSRHHLTVEFPKPPDARTATLVFNTGTAIWGSHMIREMLEARGAKADEWCEALNRRGADFFQMVQFTLREELLVMNVNVLRTDTPVPRGMIFGGGPLATENRCANLDISDISGDRLVLEFSPPKGFWTFDYLGVQYDDDSVVTPQPCRLLEAVDQENRAVDLALSEVDLSYHLMPAIGNWVDFAFEVPPQEEGLERTVLVNTTGYYQLHIDPELQEQTALIDSMLSTPGAIADHSIQLYLDKYQKMKSWPQQP